MESWFVQQLDFVFALYGLSFILMGVVLWGFSRDPETTLPWRWLALFGLIHGLNEWMDMLAISSRNSTVFIELRLGLMAGSFLCLLEFARKATAAEGRPRLGRWIYLPLLALAASGGILGLSAANASCRYALGLSGGLWTAWVLWQHHRSGGGISMRIAALTMAVYAILAGAIVPAAPFFPAAVLNHNGFLATVGIPVQMFRATLAILLTLVFWWQQTTSTRQAWLVSRQQASQMHELALASWKCGRPALSNASQNPRQRAWYLNELMLLAVLVIMIGGGWAATDWAGHFRTSEENRNQQQLVRVGAAALDANQVAALTGSEADLTNPAYIYLKKQLTQMRLQAGGVRFYYLLRPVGQTAVFLVDSEAADSSDYSPPGQAYTEISSDFLAAVQNGSSCMLQPYTDRWGSWITSVAPVVDGNGQFLATLAIDFHAVPREMKIARARLTVILISLLVSWLMIGFYAIHRSGDDNHQAIQASEERFRAAFEDAGIGMILLDRAGQSLSTNSTLPRMLGYDIAEMANRQITDLCHPDDVALDDILFTELVDGKRSHYQMERRFLRKDGQILWGLVTVTVIRNQPGIPWQALAMIEDITGRKQQQEELRQSEIRYHTLFNAATDAIFIMKDDIYVDCNLTALSLFACTRDQLLSHSPEYFSPPRQADGRDSAVVAREKITAALQGPSPTFEWTHKRLDGSLFFSEVSLSRMEYMGQVMILAIIRDITERKRAEEHINSIMATIQAGVLVSNRQTKEITEVNAAAARMIGHQPRHILGKPWTRFLPGQDRADTTQDCQLITADEHHVDVRLTQALAVVQGQQYMVQSFLDISDLKKLLTEQKVSIDLATQILNLVNRRTPRRVDLDENLELFIEAVSVPCKAAGGDHYLIRTLRTGPSSGPRTIISVKDQSGHEVNCVLRSIITDLIHHSVLTSATADPIEQQLAQLNNQLCSSGLLGEDNFLTSATIEIDHKTRVMRYACCGHPSILVIRGNRVIPLPGDGDAGRNLPIGSLADAKYTAGEWTLAEGDRVLIHTDGLTEMPIADHGLRISTEKLVSMVKGILVRHPGAPVGIIVRDLLNDITTACRQQVIPGRGSTALDDVTIIGLEVQSNQATARLTLSPATSREVADAVVEVYRQILADWKADGLDGVDSRLRLVLEEALTNAWLHGNRQAAGAPIQVSWRHRNDGIVEVVDSGNGFALDHLPDPRTRINRLETSGRGIFMIKNASDSVCWKEGGRRIIASFARKLHPQELRRAGVKYLPIQWW